MEDTGELLEAENREQDDDEEDEDACIHEFGDGDEKGTDKATHTRHGFDAA